MADEGAPASVFEFRQRDESLRLAIAAVLALAPALSVRQARLTSDVARLLEQVLAVSANIRDTDDESAADLPPELHGDYNSMYHYIELRLSWLIVPGVIGQLIQLLQRIRSAQDERDASFFSRDRFEDTRADSAEVDELCAAIADTTASALIEVRRLIPVIPSEQTRNELLAKVVHVYDQAMIVVARVSSVRAVADAEANALQAGSAAAAAKESAGIAASSSLAHHFDEFRRGRNREGLMWRLGAAVVSIVSSIFAVIHIAAVPQLSGAEVLGRLSVGLPIGLLLALMLHEGNSQRRAALWSSHMSILLKTIRAYGAELPDDTRAQLLFGFGMSLFSSPASAMDGSPGAPLELPALTLQQLGSAVQAISRVGKP